MADFIIPILMIGGGIGWMVLHLYAEMWKPRPSPWAFGQVGPAVALLGMVWLAWSLS